MKLTLEQGKELVKYARKAIFLEVEIEGYEEKRGIFVTIYTYPEKQLRGCIGFPEPIFPLKKALIDAAKAAAFNDPRFSPLKEEESFIVEVSILTKPELIQVESPEEYLEKIEIGKDGLVVEHQGMSGLLLPIVFVEYESDAEKALEMTCEKAGLPKDAWKEKECKIYKFQTQLFSEKEPNGEIEQKL